MTKSPYLTKSKFKLALECPTKLYYAKNSETYPDTKVDDPLLEALAEGGFQVGELARQYYPGGIDIDAMGHEEALRQTNDALKQDNVVIYEAAVRFENFFIRVDILEKKGDSIRIIEVKAKSYDQKDSLGFLKNNGYLSPKWVPYVYDIAFQKHVAINAFPEWKVSACLMLADKTAKATVDGLNQMFFLKRDKNGRMTVITPQGLKREDLGGKILVEVDVDDICERIFDDDALPEMLDPERPFLKWLDYLSECYKNDQKIINPVSIACKDCEFRCSPELEKTGLKSGYKECWKEQLHWTDTDFQQPHIFDIWDYKRKAALIEEGRFFMRDVTNDDLNLRPAEATEISRTERQRMQIDKAVKKDDTPYFEIDGLKAEMEKFKYPLHFIDFETSALAIPINKNLHPYEGIAFQFSHHVVHSDGRVEHKGQYLNTKRGAFPSFEFVRELKKELESDEGTIFRYAAHENTYLNFIYNQLKGSDEPDRVELMAWIQTISHSSDKQADDWVGERDMVDLCRMVKKYYYDPLTNGSNSIKQVLPAVLNRSRYLQDKYSKPIYGTDEMPSLNFKNQVWITWEDGHVVNPYKLLKPLFEGVTDDEMDAFITEESLSDGGAAMMAYAKMQFMEMTEAERNYVINGLLRYCELDTLAMVMIYEYWNNELTNVK
jgi:hypothetical protein